LKRIAGGAAAVAIALAAGAALAADLPGGRYYTAPAPLGAYSWAGPYLGGHLGYQWTSTTNNPTRPHGIAGGLQGGFNWQTGQFVFGGEADLSLSAANDTFAPWKFSNPWFGTIRGRAGYALDNILFYVTGGLAVGGGRVEVAGVSNENTHAGWTVGGGAEVGVTRNLSARVEYLYVELGGRPYALTGLSNGFTSNVLRLGVNYRF